MKGNYTEPIIIDDYNQRVPQDQDVIGTVTTQFGNPAPRHGFKIVEGVSVHPNSHALEFKGQESIKQDAAPSLRATDYKAPHCVWETVVGSKQANSFLGDVNGEAPCITSACGAGGGMTPMVTDASLKEANTDEFREQVRGHRQLQYRIRKLTPRECFRLMGVTETDIDKIQQSGVSQSQQYKMAGNSIVVDCLYHMFRKMFTETACESQQLSLF